MSAKRLGHRIKMKKQNENFLSGRRELWKLKPNQETEENKPQKQNHKPYNQPSWNHVAESELDNTIKSPHYQFKQKDWNVCSGQWSHVMEFNKWHTSTHHLHLKNPKWVMKAQMEKLILPHVKDFLHLLLPWGIRWK